MTQQNFILKFLERLVRSNLYIFLLSRFFVNKFFSKYIYETDFNVLEILKKKKYFSNKKKQIIDIGANDGISYKSIRKFLKNNTIISYEPQKYKFNDLKFLKKKDKNYLIYNFALSDNNSNDKKIFVPLYKKYMLSYFAGINKKEVIFRLKKSLFVKNLLKKISFKTLKIKIRKLDNFNLNPSFIKIDVEGHEYECILGAMKTIKKYKPILLAEYNQRLNIKILSLLKKFNYKGYYFDNKLKDLKPHYKKNVFNIFYIDKNKANIILKKNYDFNKT